MKKLFILVLLFLLAVLTAGSVYAQDIMIKADIPFAFTVGDKTFLPGAYKAERPWNTSFVFLRGSEKLRAIAMSHGVGGGPNQNVEPKLVFRRYGEQYFLAQVWMGAGNAVGREIPKSSKERQVARNTFGPELIFIAAK